MANIRIAEDDEHFDWQLDHESKEEPALEAIPVPEEFEGYPAAGDWEAWEAQANEPRGIANVVKKLAVILLVLFLSVLFYAIAKG